MKGKSWKVPSIPVLVRFNLMMLPRMQATPYQLVQKLLVFGLTQEDRFEVRVWFVKVDFHFRRALASETVAEAAREQLKTMKMIKRT